MDDFVKLFQTDRAMDTLAAVAPLVVILVVMVFAAMLFG